jgi:5-methylcytosine-specific restriction endonuclease McrA
VPQASDDLQIFVFPAANRIAQENLGKSIKNPVKDEPVFESFEEADERLREKLERIKEDGNGFYAWGAQPRGHARSTWEKMRRGDYVLGYYHKAYHHVSRVLETFHDPALATNIWGIDPETQKTWEYMYFLTKPIKIDRPVSWVADLLGRDEQSLIYQRFARMGGENREAVLDTCGSVQTFIDRLLDHDGDRVPPQLRVASRRSEDVAESSLETDQIASGEPSKKSIPREEGRKLILKHVTYERKPRNRALAIEEHGRTCTVCGFNFDEFYGREYADGYIQIHHIKPLSDYEGTVDPATDLVPLCANCHVMAHRRRTTVTSIDELKALIAEAAS